METRIFYLLGDAISCVLVAVVAALVCAFVFPASWPMPLLMIVSMFLGMVIAFLMSIFTGLIYFFGAMEIMVPTMLTGMFAGMYGVMYKMNIADTDLLSQSLFINAALIGLVTNIAVRIYSMMLGGKKTFN